MKMLVFSQGYKISLEFGDTIIFDRSTQIVTVKRGESFLSWSLGVIFQLQTDEQRFCKSVLKSARKYGYSAKWNKSAQEIKIVVSPITQPK